MLFAGTKLYERGKRNEALWNFIGRNSRAARSLQDDLDAQIASARLGAKRFAELMDRYGRELVLDATQQLMDYTERVLRQRIAAIPDGEYRAEGFLDDDGKNRDVRLPIKVCVRVEGDGIEIDLTGSSKQVETAFNVPFEGSTKVACFCAIRSLLLDAVTSDVKVPSNQGSFRPVKVTAPKGSIYNPIFPAAAEARFAQCNRVIDLIYKALAPVLPNDIIAGSSASLSFCSYAGIRPSGDYWVFLEVNEGSYGGRPRADGPDSIDNLMANTRNNPIEDLAMHLPMICDRYELRDDVMPGAGRFRGGIGVVKAQRVLTDAFITHENERHYDVPWGIFGGDSGQVGKVDIYNVARPNDVKHMPAKFSGMRVTAGDVHVFYGPCGGGFGDPLERPAAKVLDDVLDGFCTVEHARLAYGVIVDAVAETVEEAATKGLRERMRAAPQSIPAAAATPPQRAIAPPASKPQSRVPEPTMRKTANGSRAPGVQPTPAGASSASASRAAANGSGRSLPEALRGLRGAYGNAWSFEIVRHSAYGGKIEVVGQLRANGATVRETAVASAPQGRSLGELLEQTANDSLRKCIETLLRNGN
jgi:N-methylhydantoinase B